MTTDAKHKMTTGSLLAKEWPIARVRQCLRRKDREGLVEFLRDRHEERFFWPIDTLRSAGPKDAVKSVWGYGFTIMATCCLLIETIQSYRDGLPTTNQRDLDRLKNLKRVPAQYQIPSKLRVNGREAFQRFFRHYRRRFPRVRGDSFYRDIRNGLLHQAQTKKGWAFRVDQAVLYDPAGKIINRSIFADRLRHAFNDYLDELTSRDWDSSVWKNARRKIWWLMRLGQRS